MFSLIVIVALLSSASGRQVNYRTDISPNVYKDPRILFVVPVNFNNLGIGNLFGTQTCNSKFGSGTGTCQSYLGCLLKKGTFIGLCGLGTKVCCSIDSILQNIVDVATNPNNPVGTNSYKIRPNSDAYCQVRLDFVDLSIEQPSGGVCTDGTFTVSNHASSDVTICGNNAGQHMYLTFNNGEDIDMDIITASSSSTWTITTTQIMCTDSTALAPTGCLQYFQTATGTVESFNFDDYDGANIYQIANMNYLVCIDPVTTYSQADYTTTNDATDFVVTGTQGTRVTDSTTCVSDYLFFAGGLVQGTTLPFTRACGGLMTPVETPASTSPTSAAFSFQVVTDGSEVGDTFNNGFKLVYSLT